jgi:hypothetical protein
LPYTLPTGAIAYKLTKPCGWRYYYFRKLFFHDVGWIKRTGARMEPWQPTIVELPGGIGVEALCDTAFTSGRHGVEGFEKLSLRRLGKPACLRAGDEQLIGKPLERLL